MRTVAWLWTGNIRGERKGTMGLALALVDCPRTAAEFVGDVLQGEYGPLKSTTKVVARVANANQRSAENWLQKKVCPNVPAFLRLAMQTPELNAAVVWLMQHGAAHPEASKRITQMERYLGSTPEEGDHA